MARKPGTPKTGGRQKGAENKSTKDLREICEKHGVNPFEAMVILAVDEPDPDRRFEKLDKLLPYLEAKKSSVSVGIDPDKNAIKVIIEDYRSK